MEKTLHIIEVTWKGKRILLEDGEPEKTTGLGHSVRGILDSLKWYIPEDYYSANREVPFIRANIIPFNETEINEYYADDIATGSIILTDDKHFQVDFDPLTISFAKLDKNNNRINCI